MPAYKPKSQRCNSDWHGFQHSSSSVIGPFFSQKSNCTFIRLHTQKLHQCHNVTLNFLPLCHSSNLMLLPIQQWFQSLSGSQEREKEMLMMLMWRHHWQLFQIKTIDKVQSDVPTFVFTSDIPYADEMKMCFRGKTNLTTLKEPKSIARHHESKGSPTNKRIVQDRRHYQRSYHKSGYQGESEGSVFQ